MFSTALAIPSRGLPDSFGELARYLGNSTYSLPEIIVQEAGPGAQFRLAWLYLRLAIVLIRHGLAALPGHANRAACAQLARIPRSTLLALSTSSFVGWGGFVTVTALFIWR